jgi:hypothetical protein
MQTSTRRLRRAASLLGLSVLGGTLISSCSEYEYILREGDDVFYQLEAGEVDVLLVIDNSCSMQPYQQKLSSNFDAFLTFFVEGDVDYQIGVVTTSVIDPVAVSGTECTQAIVDSIPEAGHLLDGTFITPEDEDGAEIFSEWVNVGICGAGYEMGLEAANLALTAPLVNGPNAGFLRDDAYLSIIFVSDEEDASPLGVNDYINTFREVKGQRSRDVFNASSLVVDSVGDCTTQQQQSGATRGGRYLDVAEQTSGVIGNICADDFEDIVTELSLASSRLTDTFYLSQMPDASSIIVGVNGEEIPCDEGSYTYDLGTLEGEEIGVIIFERSEMPPPQSKVTVSYDLGTGEPAAFCPDAEATEDEETE